MVRVAYKESFNPNDAELPGARIRVRRCPSCRATYGVDGNSTQRDDFFQTALLEAMANRGCQVCGSGLEIQSVDVPVDADKLAEGTVEIVDPIALEYEQLLERESEE